MNKFIKFIGWKTMSGRWDVAEIKFDIAVIAAMTLIVIMAKAVG